MAVPLDGELKNVGAGPDPLPLAQVCEDNAFVVLFFQRDYYCTNCRDQVQTLAGRYEAFQKRGAEVVSIVPEPADKLAGWQEAYQLPFPLCADPEATVSEQFDQPVRFGLLGRVSDFFGRMPMVVIVDCRGPTPHIRYTHKGTSTWDRPDSNDVLARIDEAV